ncbi:polysaccharide deacetylase family protein [Paenibacillus oenotherae]|uniref:Polysaccharide deacetylase family protein n=1 Tax=Paenibacillus oenotherae TaxID=1435645 RepID=A0ABS7D0L5_9BACL|nr:polysaccharide deacetylase family protein [Paenibacillus oenotherae]MBW7473479.1 polysaccharide deacetylase family protein [Paenibacillus oenotherae]
MQTTRTIAALLLAIALTAGCGASEKEAGNGKQPAAAELSPEVVQPGQKPPAHEPKPPSTGATNNGQAPSEGTGAANEEQTPEVKPKEKLYRMDAAYRFKPINKDTPNKVVLLTFDDGPKEDEMLTSMLDTLDKHKAKAIFFVNGYRVKQHPELLTKISDRGQTVGNHSWDHIDLKKQDLEEVEKQIGDVQAIVKETIGTSPLFFRPPFGSGGDKVKSIAHKYGMLYMTWSNGSLDWDKSTKNKPELVISNVLEQLHPGANILMHELPWTNEALDTLLTKLEEKGYGFIDPETIDSGLDEAASAK